VAGRRDPTPPNGDGFNRKERKERNDGAGGKGGGKGSDIGKVLGILTLPRRHCGGDARLGKLAELFACIW